MLKKVTFKGNPVTLVGRDLKIGSPAPDFQVVSTEGKDVSLSDFKDKIKIITTFLSLDTSVCDLQVKEFNKKAAVLSAGIVVLGISKDLPFAQKRFCQLNEIKHAFIFSDYKSSSFGINYGLLIKETNLLGRAVMIIDKKDILRYIQVVPEFTNQPDYQDVLKSLTEVVKNPESTGKEELPAKCKPCQEGTPSLPKETIEKLLAQYRGWQLIEDKKIVKDFKFKDFLGAKYFLDIISMIAQEQGHHPALTLTYGKLKVGLSTHAASGLTENDFIMAKIIDEVAGSLNL